MLPIVVIQHEESVPPGSITQAFEDTGTEHYVLEAWKRPRWPSVDELGGLVVLGGTMNVDELEAFPMLRNSRRLMTDALERDLPTLGVCLGSQMMARVLGSDVVRAQPRNALFSTLDVTGAGETDLLLEPFRAGTAVLQFHEDTFTVPPDATPLARSSATGLSQAFRYGERAYAIQFHFEVDRPILRGWLDDIGDEALAEDWGVSRAELEAQADRHLDTQAAAGRELLHRFLEVASTAAR